MNEPFFHMLIPSIPIPADSIKGTKSYNKRGILPKRMRYFNPCALVDLFSCGNIVLSDMARTPEVQMNAQRTRRGSQTSDRSGHVRLLSIDLDTSATMKELGFRRKRELDEHMAQWNFYCHRTDHRLAMEAWHYNWLPDFDTVYRGERSTNRALQRTIDSMFGRWHVMDKKTVQRALNHLRLYRGEIDGIHGPITRSAIRMFQRSHLLLEDGIAGKRTQRVLAVTTATYSDNH